MVKPMVYVDTAVFLNVIQKEVEAKTGRPLWADSLKVLLAADRGDIRLVASTLLLIELNGEKGNASPAFRAERDQVVYQFLDSLDVEWVEVDHLTARDTRQVAERYGLRGADAAHLATAIRRNADYFMSRDGGFPYGQTAGRGTKVVQPCVLWTPTLDDQKIDQEAGEPRQGP